MNAFQLARTAYSPVTASLHSAQSTEYDAFAKVTRQLRDARSTAEIAQAVFDNRNLWTILAADVSDPKNELPTELKAQIFYLSEFSQLHGQRFLRGSATADALVDINSAIMAGLRQQRELA